jgi:hypothetical protein
VTTTFHHPFYDNTQASFIDAVNLRPGRAADHRQWHGHLLLVGQTCLWEMMVTPEHVVTVTTCWTGTSP